MNTFNFTRNASNQVYFSLNGNTPQLVGTFTGAFKAKWIGTNKAYDVTHPESTPKRMDAEVAKFKIGTSEWLLGEGTGATITSEDSKTAILETDGDSTHLENNIWL